MKVTTQLVNFCHNLRFKDLSNEIIDKTKYLLLDFLGVTARGALLDSSKAVQRFVSNLRTSDNSTIIGTSQKTSPEYAALVNGVSAHSLELDDVNNEASLHPGVVVFPTALAVGEMVGASGKEIILASATGYEVMVRLGKALNPAEHYRRGFHPTATCGAFGSAIAVSKLLGLNRAQMQNALGIAGSQTAGSMEFLWDGTWTKRLHPGWASHSGIVASLLAKEGFTGPSSIIEGSNGFLRSYSDKSDESKVVEGLGESFQIMKTSIKIHACCRYKHPPIDAVLDIVLEHNLKPSDIKRITIGLTKTAIPIIAEPKDIKYNPKSVVDAQFSMPYGAAVAVLKRKAFIDEYSMNMIRSSRVKEMMQKIRLVHEPDLDREFPRKWSVNVTLETKDGKKFSTRVDHPKGDPENPLSWDELISKFHRLVEPVFSKTTQREVTSRVQNLEKLTDIHTLTHLLTA